VRVLGEGAEGGHVPTLTAVLESSSEAREPPSLLPMLILLLERCGRIMALMGRWTAPGGEPGGEAIGAGVRPCRYCAVQACAEPGRGVAVGAGGPGGGSVVVVVVVVVGELFWALLIGRCGAGAEVVIRAVCAECSAGSGGGGGGGGTRAQ
jgi:hypothetical protein